MNRNESRQGNAVAESFFAALKVEFVQESSFRTRAQAIDGIFETIELFRNLERRPTSPDEVEPAGV